MQMEKGMGTSSWMRMENETGIGMRTGMRRGKAIVLGTGMGSSLEMQMEMQMRTETGMGMN